MTRAQPVNGTLRPDDSLDGYLLFEPDTPEEQPLSMCPDGVLGYTTEIHVNIGHPVLRARAEDRFGKVNVQAAVDGETVPACVWIDPDTGEEVEA